MQISFTCFQDVIGFFYDAPNDFSDTQFWKTLSTTLEIPQQCIVTSLWTSEPFIFKVFKFLTSLPYKKSARKILQIATQFLDPSASLFKKIIQELVPCLQNQIPCLSTLNVCLSFYNQIFSQESPTNQNFDSCIYLYGGQEGIILNDVVKWPFQKGGTLVFWFNMSQRTKQCKIFQCLNQEKVGFEIVVRNKKIYIQKEEDQTKFRLIKNTSSYLCDAIYNKNIKLCIEFETKKKFFQPYLCINLIMNNFVVNGVEVDSFSTSSSLFQIKLFKSFYGKLYSTLIMTDKIGSQVDQLNNQKGFIHQSDIRNFHYLFQVNSEQVFLLFSPIRSKTQCESSEPVQHDAEQIYDQLKQISSTIIKPIKTTFYDAFGNQSAQIGPKACCYQNYSIGKQIENYGGFQSILPFLNMLEICACNDELYSSALNQFLEVVKFMFQNKADSIEKACQIQFFKLLACTFEKTKMQGFTYQTITRLKQLYISLNTRNLRQKFLEDVVWGVNFGLYLSEQNFTNYIKFIKTFYNQDIQSSLHAYDLTKILHYLIQKLDSPDCCFQHTLQKQTTRIRIKNYQKTLLTFLQVLQNIILIKRLEIDLNVIIKKFIYAFGLSVSPCFIQTLIQFIQKLFEKDQLIQKCFVEFLQRDNVDCRFYLYRCLSSCVSWKAKGKIIQFILRVLQLNFFDDNKKQREMLTLCARYPTMNYLRSSSLKAKSHENRDSVDYSQDKLSLNSAAMYKFIIINPIKTKGETLLDDFKTMEVIFNWAFSQRVLNLIAEDHENPGLLILMQLYKGATYRLRERMSSMIRQKMKLIRFGPELMAWAIQCCLIAQFDLSQQKQTRTQIQQTKQNLIQLIINYNFCDPQQQQQNNEISIIKLILSSIHSKYPDDIVKLVQNKLFFIICQKKIQKFIHQLNINDHAQDPRVYDHLCTRVISNVYTFVCQYFVIKGDDGDESQFQEDMIDVLEAENLVVLDVMDKILQIFVIVATVSDRKIIQEANAERNHFTITVLFPQRDKEKQKINLMFLIFGALQNLFDFFEDLEIQPKKKAAVLIKKYMIFIIQLTENSGNAKLQHFQQDLGNMFLLVISFIERKYHQYFYYPYQRYKNIDFQLENKIRKSVDEIKKTLYSTFLDLTQLIQYIDEKGDLEHKSFYQLMKPKRKHVHKYPLKHIYPAIWKKADEKIKEFLCLKRETLRKDAQQKLQSHLILKRVSHACDSVQKSIAKKIFMFVETQRKLSDAREKKSINFYKISESQKCRNFCECEEQLLEYRIKISQEQKNYLAKQKQSKSLEVRQINQIRLKTWNINRTFEGFWSNKDFYSFSQNEIIKSDNSLNKKYQRVRSRRQTKYFLMPFIEIRAIDPINSNLNKENEQLFSNQLFVEGIINPNANNKNQNSKRITGSTASDKIINGLQFIKKKVYSKLVKAITMSEQLINNNKQESKVMLIDNVLWIKPMKVYSGYLKIQAGKLSYCHKSGKVFEHLSVFRNQLGQADRLVKQWRISDIQGFLLKRYLLKQNSIQLYQKNRKPIFFCFYNSTPEQYLQIVGQITQLCNLSTLTPDNILLSSGDPIKMWQHLQITQKWLNYQLSNLQYLMCLNIASGRSNSDLNQYPVLPWIFSRYSQTKFKKGEDKYRDFGKNMALIGKEDRVKKFLQIYQSLSANYSQQFPVPHYFGFHYSNLGIILQYLIRVNPYAEGAKMLQGGKFDITDRLFYSISQSFKCATTDMSDLRQLIPQFFYFPQFLINMEQFQFGTLQQSKKKVNHVELPDGCLNAFDFIELHREALQSKQVSQNIHKWIDLVFGYKNSGKEADRAMNTYHYLTNEVNADKIDSIEDVQEKQALESQMAYYGKTPSQIFSRAHPQRPPKPSFDFQSWQKVAFSVVQNFPKLFKDQNPSNIISQTLHFSYNKKLKTYCLLNRSGKGLIFTIDKKQIIKINQFSISYDKIQGLNTIDKTQQNISIQNVQDQCLIIGGLWGGRLLIINIINSNFEVYVKHCTVVTAIKYSGQYRMLFTGAKNGEICKWEYRDKRLYFMQKVCCYANVNFIDVNEDLKVVGVCTQQGCLWLYSIQHLQPIRVIKTPYQILTFCILQHPYYCMTLLCKNNHQYCYSLNGTKLEEGELQIQIQIQTKAQTQNKNKNSNGNGNGNKNKNKNRIEILNIDCSNQKVILRIGSQLIFIKVPDFQIQDKLSVGIGQIGFLYLVNVNQIVVLNQGQVLLWRKNIEDREAGKG